MKFPDSSLFGCQRDKNMFKVSINDNRRRTFPHTTFSLQYWSTVLIGDFEHV